MNYVFTGSERVAIYATDNAATPSRVLRYLHQDHLGSVDTVTNENGAVVERLSYDAWGKRRTASGEDAWEDAAVAITGASTPRGFPRSGLMSWEPHSVVIREVVPENRTGC